ncbi:MAG TPA: hypothetical protein ENI23_06360, partial [bacterium]|nr:hypothetical protein [bacterium]
MSGNRFIVFLILFLSIPAFIIALIALRNSNNVVSDKITDGTIQEGDIQDILKATLKLPDGQLVDIELLFASDGEGIDLDVLGLTTDNGFWRVLSQDDALGVSPPLGGIGGDLIANNAIGANHIGPEFLSSVDGVSNDGGNVDFIPGSNILISPSNGANAVTFSVNTLGLDADTLDGFDNTDFLKITGGTITGDLTINNDLTVLGNSFHLGTEFFNDIEVSGTATINELIVTGESFHFGQESFFGGVNVESSIYNNAGTLLIDDDAEVAGNLDVKGDITIWGNSLHKGDETFLGIIDAQGGITNTTGDPLNLFDDDAIVLETPIKYT